MKRWAHCFPLVFATLLLIPAQAAHAQQIVFGGGLNAGSVPRSLSPLCASARRLNGAGVTATAGYIAKGFRLNVSADYVNSGSVSVAECIPRAGMSTDSLFASADNSTILMSAAGWMPIANRVDIGVETGWVTGHSSRFIGAALGSEYRHLRVEVAGRLHSTSFEEITRDFSASPVREISRRKLTERDWGITARVLLLTLSS